MKYKAETLNEPLKEENLYVAVIFFPGFFQVFADLFREIFGRGDADETGVLHGDQFHIKRGNADGAVILPVLSFFELDAFPEGVDDDRDTFFRGNDGVHADWWNRDEGIEM